MVGALSVAPAKDYADLRKRLYAVEGHIREADSLKGPRAPE